MWEIVSVYEHFGLRTTFRNELSSWTEVCLYLVLILQDEVIFIQDILKEKVQIQMKNVSINPLTPNDAYSGRTAQLSSKRCILYIYSTNIGTEYFKHGIYSPFFLLKMQFVS